MRGRLIRRGLPVLLVAVAGVGAAMAATASTNTTGATVKAAKSMHFGTILVGPNGRTLYRYTVDRRHVNRCSGNATCNRYWPALLVKPGSKPNAGAGASAALLGTIAARGGKRQVTYAGYPLYYFAGDRRAGQTSGQGFQSKWYVVNTKGGLVKRAVAAAQPAPAPPPTTTSVGGDTWG